MILWSFVLTPLVLNRQYPPLNSFLPTFALPLACFAIYVLSLPFGFASSSCHLHIDVLTYQASLYIPLYR